MDVLISGPAEEAGAVYLHLHKGSYDALSADFTELPKATDQVLVMDFNNDLHLDLYGVSFESGQRTAWVNKGGFEYELKEVYLPGQAYKKLASPHSNAFVDMDGDCLSDLFLSTHDPETDSLQLELWLNRKSE